MTNAQLTCHMPCAERLGVRRAGGGGPGVPDPRAVRLALAAGLRGPALRRVASACLAARCVRETEMHAVITVSVSCTVADLIVSVAAVVMHWFRTSMQIALAAEALQLHLCTRFC